LNYLDSSQAIADHIVSIYRDHVRNNDELNQTITANVFAITMKFESIELNGSRQDPSSYLNAYDAWFRSLMISSFGNNLGRKRHLQPLSYAFLDFPNSRGSNPIPNRSELLQSGLLHIHAVIALRLGTGQACRRPLLVAGSAHQLRRFGDVKVEPFDPSRGSLENMVTYFKKGADAVGSFYRSDAYDVFPRFKNSSAKSKILAA
jgi:hypothetical protein